MTLPQTDSSGLGWRGGAGGVEGEDGVGGLCWEGVGGNGGEGCGVEGGRGEGGGGKWELNPNVCPICCPKSSPGGLCFFIIFTL